MNRISNLNWYQKIGADQLSWWSEELDNAMFNRLASMMSQSGIINETDPRTDTTTWNLSYNSGTVTVGSGKGMTLNGIYLELENSYDVPLPYFDIPSTWLIIAEATIVNVDSSLNEFSIVEPVYYKNGVDIILVDANTDWQDATIWSTTRKDNSIIVGVLRIGLVDGVNTFTIDYDTTDYDSRAWFSIADYYHRNELGSGNNTVPHNIGLSDLSDGDITIYNQLRANGFVLAKDKDVKSIAGTLCEATFVPSDFNKDPLGVITGVIDANYAYAPHYIERLTHASNTVGDPVCLYHIEQTNVLYFLPSDNIPASGINVEYTIVGSLAPIVDFSKHKVMFNTSLDNEVVVGKGKAGVITESFSFDTLEVGPLPGEWIIWYDGYTIYPQLEPVSCPCLLENIGSIEQGEEETFNAAKKIVVGLGLVSMPSPSLSVQITLTGKDGDGNSVTETLKFDSTTYLPSSTSSSSTMVHDSLTGTTYTGDPGNYLETYTSFSELETWQIVDRQNDGLSSVVTVFKKHAYDGELEIATIYYDGVIIERINDIRKIYRQIANSSSSMKNLVDQFLLTFKMSGYLLSSLIYPDVKIIQVDDYIKWKYIDAKNTDNVHRNPWYSNIFPVIQNNGFFITRAINLQEDMDYFTSISSPSILLLKGKDIEVYIRGVQTTTPTVWDAWINLGVYNGFVTLGSIPSNNWEKIQFKFKATKLEGYGIIGIKP